MSLQHVAATDHSVCTGRATSCSNKVRRHVAATNRFVCTGEFLCKSLSPQQNFVAATSRKKSNQTESVRLVAATKFCCSDKHFLQILQYTRSDLSLRRVASPCCCNLLPSVTDLKGTTSGKFLLVKSEIQLKDYGSPLATGIQKPSPTDVRH